MIYSPVTKVLDWLSALISLVIIPFTFLTCFFLLKFVLNDELWSFIMLVFVLILFLFLLQYYMKNYRKLTNYATETAYVHFKPSYKELILGLYSQAFTLFVLIIIVLLFLPKHLFSERQIVIISSIMCITLALQLLITFLINHSKIKLIKTAEEPLDVAILEKMKEKTYDITKINKFFYADIKPASLFLSAGVTNYSFKSHICLVSRYFQWKLSEEELLAVLSHEVGHIVHRDMTQSRILLALQAVTRTLLFYFLFMILSSFYISEHSDFILLSTRFVILSLLILAQILTSFSLQLRMFNQEIMADEYGASIMGNYNMSYTLKKLPKVIPAPVDNHPLNFLGFRIAILQLRAKNLNEIDTSPKEFSRYSNN